GLGFRSYYELLLFKKNETTATTMTAPINDRTIAIQPTTGPQVPKRAWPIKETIKPEITYAMTHIRPPLFVIAPATAPIIPPTINVHNQPIEFLLSYFTGLLKRVHRSIMSIR